MKNKQLILAGIVVLLIIAGGFYYFFANNVGSPSSVATTTEATSTSGTKAAKPTGSAGSSATNSSGSAAQSFGPSLEGVSLSVSSASGVEPFTTKFSGTVPSSLTGSYTFSLVYGDGTSAAVVPSCVGTACTVSASHTYSISGNFVPDLSATTKCASTIPVGVDCDHVSYVIAKTPVTVTGDGATASLVITPALAKAGTTLNILVKGSGSSLRVDFGDGASESLAPMTDQIIAVEHAYAAAGTYTLKVTNGTETLTSQSVVVQ
jgi:hypothetical protein